MPDQFSHAARILNVTAMGTSPVVLPVTPTTNLAPVHGLSTTNITNTATTIMLGQSFTMNFTSTPLYSGYDYNSASKIVHMHKYIMYSL